MSELNKEIETITVNLIEGITDEFEYPHKFGGSKEITSEILGIVAENRNCKVEDLPDVLGFGEYMDALSESPTLIKEEKERKDADKNLMEGAEQGRWEIVINE